MVCCYNGGDKQFNRVHLKGPPGSRRTTLVFIKAREFLKQSGSHHVVVVNIYRGAPGRSVGLYVCHSIANAEDGFSSRTHHLPLDANKPRTQQEVVGEVEQTLRDGGVDEVGSTAKKALKAEKGAGKVKHEDVMFVVDELIPVSLWENILRGLLTFKGSLIWCTDGLVSQDLGEHENEFHTVEMRCMCRIPPTVQKVLYHVDWHHKKLKRYHRAEYKRKSLEIKKSEGGGEKKKRVSDTPTATKLKTSACLSTRGPIPLCIRHERHQSQDVLLQCSACAEELAELLTDKLGLQMPPEGGVLQCSVVILFSIPRKNYRDTADGNHVEITKTQCEAYTESLAGSPFIQALQQRLPNIEVLTKVEETRDLDDEGLWSKLLVSWVDKFQGLVRDVVIFLPSEPPPHTSSEEASAPEQQSSGPTEDTSETADARLRTSRLRSVQSSSVESVDRDPEITETASQPPKLPLPGVAKDDDNPTASEEGSSESAIPQAAAKDFKGTDLSHQAESFIRRGSRTVEKGKEKEERAIQTLKCHEGVMTHSQAAKLNTSQQAATYTPARKRETEESTESDTWGPPPASCTSSRSKSPASFTKPEDSSFSASTRLANPTPLKPHACEQRLVQGKGDNPKSSRTLAGHCWVSGDVQRFSPWDRVNLVYAASRATGQLILLVP
jgi:hypothetical protein